MRNYCCDGSLKGRFTLTQLYTIHLCFGRRALAAGHSSGATTSSARGKSQKGRRQRCVCVCVCRKDKIMFSNCYSGYMCARTTGGESKRQQRLYIHTHTHTHYTKWFIKPTTMWRSIDILCVYLCGTGGGTGCHAGIYRQIRIHTHTRSPRVSLFATLSSMTNFWKAPESGRPKFMAAFTYIMHIYTYNIIYVCVCVSVYIYIYIYIYLYDRGTRASVTFLLSYCVTKC